MFIYCETARNENASFVSYLTRVILLAHCITDSLFATAIAPVY